MAGRTGRLAGAAALAAGMVIAGSVVAVASHNSPPDVPPEVNCSFDAERGTMVLRLREGRDRAGFPPGVPRGRNLEALLGSVPVIAKLERRRDAITVLEGGDWVYGDNEGQTGPLPCADGDPTVDNTDRIKVRAGKHTDDAQLLVDLAYGDFEPGLTAEPDGSSEIELDARFEGASALRLSRDADTVTAGSTGNEIGVSINPTEATPDLEATFARRGFLVVDGAGGGDLIDGSQFSLSMRSLGSVYLAGGQGDDSITGGPGSDFLTGDSGADVIEAGSGVDAVMVSGRGADRIDCGPGKDLVFSFYPSRGDHRYSRCEEIDTFEEFFRPEPANRPLRRAARELRQLRRG